MFVLLLFWDLNLNIEMKMFGELFWLEAFLYFRIEPPLTIEKFVKLKTWLKIEKIRFRIPRASSVVSRSFNIIV